jgi:hypothetical protein
MKFTLTYDGPLPSIGNTFSAAKRKEVWSIREQISDQLADLWTNHPSLKIVNAHRHTLKTESFINQERHHLNEVPTEPFAPLEQYEYIDICSPTTIAEFTFIPLVRDSIGLVCSLDILFLRAGPKGNVYKAGDLDNRIKTLLDALRVPSADEINATALERHKETKRQMYTLLEDDKFVTGLSVKTAQLLNPPGVSDREVRLVIDVDVRVTHPRTYNTVFLGD